MAENKRHERYDWMHEKHLTGDSYCDLTDDQLTDLAADQLPQMIREFREIQDNY